MAIGSTVCWILSQHWSLQLLSAAILTIYGSLGRLLLFAVQQSFLRLPATGSTSVEIKLMIPCASLLSLSHFLLHALPLVVVVMEEEEPVMMVNRHCRQWIKGGNIGKIVV